MFLKGKLNILTMRGQNLVTILLTNLLTILIYLQEYLEKYMCIYKTIINNKAKKNEIDEITSHLLFELNSSLKEK